MTVSQSGGDEGNATRPPPLRSVHTTNLPGILDQLGVATAETIRAGDEREELHTGELTAEDYVEFMSPLVGSWKSTGEEGGKTTTGTWTYLLAPNKKCFLMNSTNESGPESQTVDGYNPVTKKYTVAGFEANGNFLFLTMDLPAVKKGRRLGKGVLGTWEFKTCSRDGKTTMTTSTFICEEVREDRVVFVFTDCREDGKRMPDARWTLERTVQKKE